MSYGEFYTSYYSTYIIRVADMTGVCGIRGEIKKCIENFITQHKRENIWKTQAQIAE
jgi:hypothetical protein